MAGLAVDNLSRKLLIIRLSRKKNSLTIMDVLYILCLFLFRIGLDPSSRVLNQALFQPPNLMWSKLSKNYPVDNTRKTA